jgi:hypothetical protein
MVHLLGRDSALQPLIREKWASLPSRWHFDGFRAYKAELITSSIGIAVLRSYRPPGGSGNMAVPGGRESQA